MILSKSCPSPTRNSCKRNGRVEVGELSHKGCATFHLKVHFLANGPARPSVHVHTNPGQWHVDHRRSWQQQDNARVGPGVRSRHYCGPKGMRLVATSRPTLPAPAGSANPPELPPETPRFWCAPQLASNHLIPPRFSPPHRCHPAHHQHHCRISNFPRIAPKGTPRFWCAPQLASNPLIPSTCLKTLSYHTGSE